jgi:hypothetical protein
MSKRLLFVTLLAASSLSVALTACNGPGDATAGARANAPATDSNVAPPPVVNPTQRGSVRFIQLPERKPQLPDGNMRDIVLVQCGMCHTPQYITLQPPLSREQWTASVNKMRTTYGGPIPEEQVEPIVEYLVAVNGAK